MDISINCCPSCLGDMKLWDFSDEEEPSFSYCRLCDGNNTINS